MTATDSTEADQLKTTECKTCEKHGDYLSTLTLISLFGKERRIASGCAKCKAEMLVEEEQKRKRDETQRLHNAIKESGIPPRFLERRHFEATTKGHVDAFEFAREYVQNFSEVLQTGRSAIFIGGVGTGKTHLACSIAYEVIEAGTTARYSTVSNMFNRIKNTWRPYSEESQSQAIDAFTRPSLLVLDEVGIGFGSETEQKLLFDVMDARYQHRLPSILISNLDLDGVKATIGTRIYDRLREDDGQVVAFNGASFRGRKKPD